MIKFLGVLGLEEFFDHVYGRLCRDPEPAYRRMLGGILMLLFIGFNRLCYSVHIRLEALISCLFQFARFVTARTFWQGVNSLWINHANSILKVSSVLWELAWKLGKLRWGRSHLTIDTTEETDYVNQECGRVRYNTSHLSNKAYCPVLCFVDATRECHLGKFREEDLLDGEESAATVTAIKGHLPGYVKKVLLTGDGEFFTSETVLAATQAAFQFIIANKTAGPLFHPSNWYQPRRRNPIQYDSCAFQPLGWEFPCRFVPMRIPKEQSACPSQPHQGEPFEEDRYIYRIFCTHLHGKPHNIIAQYDKRTDAQNPIREANPEDLDSTPSAKFKNTYACFQIALLPYNLCRYHNTLPHKTTREAASQELHLLKGIQNRPTRIARLTPLLITAKLASHSHTNRDHMGFSIYDTRSFFIKRFSKFLDDARAERRPRIQSTLWRGRFPVNAS